MSTKVDNNNFITRHISHHFYNADQEFNSCKMGMWLFLLTEFMLFGGLFVAYTIFRSWYPETFDSGASKLDWTFGAVNTVVLITSSLTMALAIRACQLNKKKQALGLILGTVACASIFLVIKYFEYHHKFELGILPGKFFCFQGEHMSNEHIYFSIYFLMTGTHVLHVILGMIAMLWIAARTAKGEFYSAYYTPVEMVGLYWHLVDLIWIFLFPLLYLTK